MGCPKCQATFQVVEEVAKTYGFSGIVEKIEDVTAIISYGVMSTPAVVIDGKVVFVGGVPSKEQVQAWFTSLSSCCCK